MDEKHAPMPPPIRRGVGPARLLMALGYLSLAAVTYWYFNTRATVLQSLPSPPSPAPVAATNALVPLEAHIMSKCPDARDCLRELVLPAMQKAHEKVNFTLSFIGKYVLPARLPKVSFPSATYLTPRQADGRRRRGGLQTRSGGVYVALLLMIPAEHHVPS
jgi:hypothetical protein